QALGWRLRAGPVLQPTPGDGRDRLSVADGAPGCDLTIVVYGSRSRRVNAKRKRPSKPIPTGSGKYHAGSISLTSPTVSAPFASGITAMRRSSLFLALFAVC